MASFPLSLAPLFTIFSLLFSVAVSGETHNENNYAFTESFKVIRDKEKMTHLKLYWHDIYSGPNPTVVQTVRGPRKFSATGFGSINMIDDPLTVGPELGSKLIGKAQGFYGMASQEEIGLIMAMNFAFTDGAYNGSTISVLGRNEVLAEVREMSVIGGTGVFRFARGYVEARTYKFDTKLGDATVEYNIYVLHY